MALYWPEQRVALDIVDDPYRRPFEGDDSYTVLRVTCADLRDYNSYRKVMKRLCELLGREMPALPRWDDTDRDLGDMLFCWDMEEELLAGSWTRESDVDSDMPSQDTIHNVEILAADEESGRHMKAFAEHEGRYVRNVSIWDGPTPEGSYADIGPTMRMSTPEFFFLRKANQLPFADAVSMGNELCGKFRTSCTQYSLTDGYDFLAKPRTNKARLRKYLRGARGTKECKRAKRVLRYVVDECSSPMGNYLYVLLCLPRSHGGYGIAHAVMSGAFEEHEQLMPASSGPYLAYDLCWPDQRVAIQYTGASKPSVRALEALNAGGMHTICVTDKDAEDPELFDKIARKLARKLGVAIPEPDDKQWLAARKRLRRRLEMPRYACMRLTIDDISEHR
ncbi:MAG: hypothetical protein Q4A01_05440 [Coriobacteriales bacterium]|nr:hypothetical protein [Coriobacteriales bacterium]